MTPKTTQDYDYLLNLIDTMNALMLSIMDSANPNALYNVLFDLLIKSQTEMVHEKLKGLTVKCLVRHAKSMDKHKDEVDLGNILYKMHQYILEVDGNKSQELGVKAIKTVIKKIVDLVGDDKIYEAYSSVENSGEEDTCIKHWIDIVVKNLKKERQKKEMKSKTLSHHRNHSNYSSYKSSGQSSDRNYGNPSQNDGYSQLHNRQMPQQSEPSRHNFPPSDGKVKQIIEKFKEGNLRTFPKIIFELHCEMLNHPDIQIEDYLGSLNKNHSKYILKELKRHQDRENVKPDWSATDRSQGALSSKKQSMRDIGQYQSRSTIKPANTDRGSPYYQSNNRSERKTMEPNTNEMMKRLASMREKMRDYLHNPN